jgi:hypothetical protein
MAPRVLASDPIAVDQLGFSMPMGVALMQTALMSNIIKLSAVTREVGEVSLNTLQPHAMLLWSSTTLTIVQF